ncbi:MAG: hypothetical protein ACI3XS_03700 [Eubacteriales bacterium]
MKKAVKIVSMALLLVAVTVMLVSCSSFSKIKRNFEDAGYKVVENDDEANTITAELEEGNISCTAHLFQKKGDILTYNALVLEFKSDEDLNKALSESETLKGLVKDLQNSKLVNGNCLLIPLSPTKADEMISVFNQGK